MTYKEYWCVEAVALQDPASSDGGGFGKELSCRTLLASPKAQPEDAPFIG